MKISSVLIFLFVLVFDACLGQTLNTVRNLGKLNFADSANLILSAKVDNGKYTYELSDTKNPQTPVFSFSLVSNSLDVFKESIKANVKKSGKSINLADSTLGKYFFYFENQNPFLIENVAGGPAMEMFFSDSITIYNFKHNDFSRIRQSDVFELINSLLGVLISYEKHNSSIFEYSMYDTLFIKNINSDFKYLFNNGFEGRLQEIKNGSPKSLRLEELYKEIQYRYYNALILQIEKVVAEKEDSTNKTIKEIQNEIATTKNRKKELINESSSLEIDNIEKSQLIVKSRGRIDILNKRIQSELILLDFPENAFPDNALWQEYFDLRFAENNSLAEGLSSRVNVVPSPLTSNFVLDSAMLETRYYSDLAKIQQKGADLTELNLENVRIQGLEAFINQNRETLQSLERSMMQIEIELKNKSQKINDLYTSVLAEIETQLKALKQSNKFHFKARNIQLEFNRGYLENIVVVGEASIFIEPELESFKKQIPLPEFTLKFVNDFPIGISAKRDIERLGEIKLYSRYEDDIHYELRLGDLITNTKEILALNRTDYSPKDSAIEINLLTEKNIELKKSDTKEILQLKVFSDFVGLQEENPNGLIQVEVDKEIPLVTKRITRPYVWVPLRFIVNKSGNLGFLNFIRPRFVYSKIEDNNRFLELKSFQVAPDSSNSEPSERFGTSTLDLKQFERFSIGADLNLLLYNIPYGKSTFLINAGMYFGRTDLAISDSVPESSNLSRPYTNSYQPSLELMWRVTGDERYGLEFSYGITWVISDQQNFTQRASTLEYGDFESFQDSEKKYGIQRFMILAYLNLDSSSAGRLFFRYRSNSELWNLKNNFSQLQIGYTTYLTKKTQ